MIVSTIFDIDIDLRKDNNDLKQVYDLYIFDNEHVGTIWAEHSWSAPNIWFGQLKDVGRAMYATRQSDIINLLLSLHLLKSGKSWQFVESRILIKPRRAKAKNPEIAP